MGASHTHGGAKVGTRVATLVSKTIIATHNGLLSMKHKLALAIFHSISDVISREAHSTLDPTFLHLMDNTSEESPAHPLLKFMATETGQLQAMIGTLAGMSGITWSISQILNNELAPAVYEYIATNPHGVPDAGTIANLYAKGTVDYGNAAFNINKNGLDSGWADAMLQASRSGASMGDALDMLRRHAIDQDVFFQWGRLNGLTDESINGYLSLVRNPLSPADAALAVLRGNMDQGTAEGIASDAGLDAGSFQTLIDNTGEPLALMQLLEAYRRGFIDKGTLDRGIQQSRIRNEWIPVAEMLRYSPMSVSDAVNAVVQNHLDAGTAAGYAQENGLDPSAFPILVETAGEPLSRTEMEQLYNRGIATKDDVLQALRESRLKDKYGTLAFDLHTRLLPVREISDAVYYGTLTHDQGVSKVMLNGYSVEDATALVAASSARKLQQYRLSVVSSAETLYVDNIISRDDAMAIAGQMGVEPNEAAAIFEAADLKRETRLVSTAVNAIRSKYIGHHILDNDASGALDGLGIPAQARDDMLAIWSIERSANVKTLTEAQIVKAFNLGLIQSDDATTRLINLGYTDVDAGLLLGGA